jgi:hypothetical protein
MQVSRLLQKPSPRSQQPLSVIRKKASRRTSLVKSYNASAHTPPLSSSGSGCASSSGSGAGLVTGTRRTGGGANGLEDFFPANAGGVYIVGGGAFFAAVDPRKERNIAPADDTSTSPNFYPPKRNATIDHPRKSSANNNDNQQ